MIRSKNVVSGSLLAFVLSLGAWAMPATAQNFGQGLVVVQVGDITTGDILSQNRVGVGVAAQVLANVCGLQAQVGVIANQIARGGSPRCENEATQEFAQIVR
jgi:hypothetical protein